MKSARETHAAPATGNPPTARAAILNTTVIVAALGYFVDIYDIVLFSIVRVPSLKGLGVPDGQLLEVGVRLLNMQMVGMLLGGLLWGVLGDRRGRVSVLFGSILLYSLANLANAAVTSTAAYGWLRLVAGIGLAGELGAAVTLVSETLPTETRGYGTSFVAGIGTSGAILAAFVGQSFSWQTAYVIGGVFGLLLLALRMKIFESGMYASMRAQTERRGDFRLILGSPARLGRYFSCILIGVPLWFVIGVLVTFSPEICRELDATGEVSAGTAILFAYLGLTFGDLASGFLSQLTRSRKRVVMRFLLATLGLSVAFITARQQPPAFYYAMCAGLGFFAGYLALFVTIAAEQFGTNLRATVAITAPNFVRGSVVAMTLALSALKGPFGLTRAALYVGLASFALAIGALAGIQESHGRDLDFLEN